MKQKFQTNKMGVAPVKKLLIAMGLPMMISMALQAFYNIVDSYFVSCMQSDTVENMGDYAVNALTLAFPIQMLMVAIGVGTGVGINAILSKYLGQGKREYASRITGNAIFLGFCSYIVFLIFGLLGVNAYISSQTSDSLIIELGNEYLFICTTFSFGVSFYMTFEKLLQSTGKTLQCTIAQIAGALVNIILDPIMIFGWLGCPEMGVAGAAYATVIGQCVSFVLNAVFHFKYNKQDVDTDLKYLKPQKNIIIEIYKVGIPAILMQALMSFMTYGVNVIFGAVSAASVTAYGIYYKIQQFVFFAAFGMNNAIIPVVAFNYGMKNEKRVNESIKYGMIYEILIMLIGGVVLQVFANQICSVFVLSDETRSLCILAIRIITLGYLFVGANIAFQGIFQALGRGVSSLVVSLLRLIVIALPLAYIFTLFDSAELIIWTAFPIAEAVAFVVAVIIMIYIYKTQLRYDYTELVDN